MTGATHKRYSTAFTYIAIMLLYGRGVLSINYYLQIPLMLLVGKWAAEFPDVDHIWKNVKEKNTFNFILNQLIHKTGGKHRSWQTHSIDIVTLFTVLSVVVPEQLYKMEFLDVLNKEVLKMIWVALASGWISHIFSDMLTPSGVYLFCWSKYKVRFVPKRLWKWKFSTGSSWEIWNYRALRYINMVLGLLCFTRPYFAMVKQMALDIITKLVI